MKQLTIIVLISTLLLTHKAFSQSDIPAKEAQKYIGQTKSVYGTIYNIKIERDKKMSDSLNVLLYVGNKPPNEDFIIIIKRENSKRSDAVLAKQYLKKYGFSPDCAAEGKIFRYENKPAILIHKKDDLKIIFLERVDGGITGPPTPDENQIFTYVDKSPEFPGDVKGLNLYLKRNLKRFKAPRGSNGKVFATFVVEKDGSLTDVHIVNGLDRVLNTEAARVIRESPKWHPGFNKGKRVRVAYVVQVNFSIAQ